MAASVVLHPQSRQTSARRDKAVDPPLRTLMPPDIEGGKLREELQLAVLQVVMNPPGHRPPVGALGVAVREPGDDDCGKRPHASTRVALVPNVTGIVALVRRATQAMGVAEGIDRWSAVG